MLFLVESIHESSFLVEGGGEACGLSFPVICALVLLLNSGLEPPSSSLPLGEDADGKPHGMMVRPPLMGDGWRLWLADCCCKRTSLARPVPSGVGGRTGLPHIGPQGVGGVKLGSPIPGLERLSSPLVSKLNQPPRQLQLAMVRMCHQSLGSWCARESGPCGYTDEGD